LFSAILGAVLLAATPAHAKLQERCAASEAVATANEFIDPTAPVLAQAGAPINPGIIPTVVAGPTAESGRPHYPTDVDIFRWAARVQAFPVTSVNFENFNVSYLGVRLVQNPNKDDCLATAVVLFAPEVIPDKRIDGVHFVFPGAKGLAARQIDHSSNQPSAAQQPLLYDSTETFYVINLTEIESRVGSQRWSARANGFEQVMKDNSRSPAYRRVQFQRFVLDLIRTYRYSPPGGGGDEFRVAVNSQLAARGIHCPEHVRSNEPQQEPATAATPDAPPLPCVLKSSFLETELGKANPFAVTDALDNSGLAFGPRQLDVGQHAEVGAKYLLADMAPADHATYAQFLRPIERLTPSGLSMLYRAVIPKFNQELQAGPARDFIIQDFIASITAPVPAADLIKQVQIDRPGDHAGLEAVVIDFGNKWTGQTRAVAQALQPKHFDSACDAAIAWEQTFAKLAPSPGDVADAYRRAHIVLQAFNLEAGRNEVCRGLVR